MNVFYVDSCQVKVAKLADAPPVEEEVTTVEPETTEAPTTVDPCTDFFCYEGFTQHRNGDECMCIFGYQSVSHDRQHHVEAEPVSGSRLYMPSGQSSPRRRPGGQRRTGRDTDAHHARGGPIELRQPLVQARNHHV